MELWSEDEQGQMMQETKIPKGETSARCTYVGPHVFVAFGLYLDALTFIIYQL